ncbi:MAG: penicillin-binding protein 2 [bacterium]
MKKSVTSKFLFRIRALTLVCVCVMLVVVGRLYYLQMMRGYAYASRANAQFVEPASPLLDRGAIYFLDKNNTLLSGAILKEGFSLAVNPNKVTDPEALYVALQTYIPLSHDDFIAKATKRGTQYQLIAQHLSSDAGTLLETQSLPGLIIQNDRWRLYPGGSLAAQEIGFVAYNGDVQEGRYGLERSYEKTLARASGDLYANFFVEIFGGVQHALSGTPEQGDIITTIEPSVQAELERQLTAYDNAWHPKLSGGIIMNPQNGEIYAMAVSPTFDLNNFKNQSDPLTYANPMVQNSYEMGSIIKPLTMAAGLDSGVITATTTYNDTGCLTLDKKTICNFDHKPRGVIPMQQILSQSLNVGASFIAGQMGSSTMRNYFLDHYMFGTSTGVDLPAEVHGQVSNLQSPRAVEYDTASYGQGIALTPIETARALSTIANGGFLVTPHLVRQIRYTTGVTRDVPWPPRVSVLKPETALTVSRMLTSVVDLSLANGKDKLDGYSVAAKTGTAQIANPGGGGYYTDRYLHSFFGYFPSYDAKFIIFLFAVEPHGAKYASETLAPPWHELTQFLINYYNVPPDR